tara:strand:+ start:239 stop:478 length:240 start_codon:yes stop_codon:yes gene_type:complete
MNKKVQKYNHKKDLLNQEKIIINKKIERLQKKIKRRNNKIEKLNNKLLIVCDHKWVPDFSGYNVYDRPKVCEKCNLYKM